MRTAREQRNERIFARAQAAWDAMEPQDADDETWEPCERCHERGYLVVNGEPEVCPLCLGETGYVGSECISRYEFDATGDSQ